MTSYVLQICAAQRLPLALLQQISQLTQVENKLLVARATTAVARLRRRRSTNNISSSKGAEGKTPATLLQKRRVLHGCHSLQRLLQRRLDMATQQQQGIRRRSSVADRDPVHVQLQRDSQQQQPQPPSSSSLDGSGDAPVASPAAAVTTSVEATPLHSREQSVDEVPSLDTTLSSSATATAAAATAATGMAAPSPQTSSHEMGSPIRLSRSTSTASRHTNRLSLTLPIALSNGDLSLRPMNGTSTGSPSIPPTPTAATEVPASSEPPSSTSEFIIAIAAQERRVLELREELSRAETDLTSLKRQWSSQEAYNKRHSTRGSISSHPMPASQSVDETSVRQQSMDMDRRRMLLQQQQQQQQGTGTPTQGRRKVLRGGHTRTLSLLTPIRSSGNLSTVGDESDSSASKPHPMERRSTQPSGSYSSKRTSWQSKQQPLPIDMPGLVEDFKLGLKAFVEDIRQITVGDEPVRGYSSRSPIGQQQQQQQQHGQNSNSRPGHNGGDSDDLASGKTLRMTSRPKVSTSSDSPSVMSPGTATSPGIPTSGKSRPKNKSFSWTPLGLESLNDNDWSHWESPGSAKSARWSGSTINSDGMGETTQAVPESKEPLASPVTSKTQSGLGTPMIPPNFEELLPNVVNRLSPSNIKRTAQNLMDEWEKSLAGPTAAEAQGQGQ